MRLLDEVTALVEWPVPIAGRFEQRFLSLPREVVIATVQDHQRYFAVQGADGKLSGWFVTVSNIESRDPSKVREGNERVVRPRLSDAAFFWEQDRKITLERMRPRFAGVTFQTKLGSYADKTLRVSAGASSASASARARRGASRELAKADLMTAMVGEFPELQGTMGRYYAEAQGLPRNWRWPSRNITGRAMPAMRCRRPRPARPWRWPTRSTRWSAFSPSSSGRPAPRIPSACAARAGRAAHPAGGPAGSGFGRAAGESRRRAAGAARRRGRRGLRLHRRAAARLLLEREPGTTAEMLDAVLANRPRSPLDAVTRLQALKEFLLLPDAAVLAAINKRIQYLEEGLAGGECERSMPRR
jgi:glycyl-tRNA synthetase beta chain